MTVPLYCGWWWGEPVTARWITRPVAALLPPATFFRKGGATMALPFLMAGLGARAIGRRFLPRIARTALPFGAGALATLGIGGATGGDDRPRRRRARTLTKGQMNDLMFISHHIGKTAAGEYLHFIRP